MTLTIDMLKDAQRKLMASAPPPSEIQVGSPLRFREAMKAKGALIEGREDRMIFGGVPVVFHPAVPEHIAVIVEGGQVKSIINLNSESKEQSE
jgi:hypothetical protein